MLIPSINVRISPIAGKGIFTTKPIRRGETVWRLDMDEPRLTYDELRQLPEYERSLAFQFEDRYIICHEGSEYMNHSCDPNTWWASDTELVARRDVAAGKELTYDYVSADVSPPWTAAWRCHCGAAICRHTISSDDYKDRRWQKRFEGHLPSWVVRAINAQQPT
jgi:SET domain-containing protein